MKVLHSKLLPPKLSGTITRKPDGIRWEDISRKRLTTVTAGAGYGKTTFIAQAAAATDTVWYRLADTDKDFYVFLNYLAAGIGRYYPAFGEKIHEYFKDERAHEKDVQAVLTYFLHAMEMIIDRELTIVLDDFHTVQDSTEIQTCVQFLVEHLPSSAHAVIISRTRVDLALSRLKVMGEIAEITERDLVFSNHDTAKLFERTFGMRLSPETIRIIHSRSQGWIAGLILFYHAIRGMAQGEIDKLLLKLQKSGRGISEYFEENVFAFLPGEIRSFLLKTSLFSRLSSPLCDRFLNTNNSESILKHLEKNHLFTFSLDEEGQEYAYHHLFQDFLQSRMVKELSEGEICELHKKAAGLFEEQGMFEEAVTHYLAVREYTEATRVLVASGMEMFMEGRIKLLRGFIDKIPGEIVSTDPWLMYLEGQLNYASGKPKEAILELENARDIFEEKGQQFGADLCGLVLGYIYWPLGYFRKAEELFSLMLKSPSCDPMVYNMLVSQLVFITAFLGKPDAADGYFREGMERTAVIGDKARRDELQALLFINHSIRYFLAGDFRGAFRCCEQARKLIHDDKSFRLLSLFYNNASMADFYTGRYSQGLENAEAGLKILRENGFKDPTLGWLLLGYCANCMGLKRYPEALDHAKQALMFFHETGSLWGEASVHATMQWLHIQTGDIHAAEKSTQQGLKLLETLEFPDVRHQLIIGLALIRTLQGNITEAQALIDSACSKTGSSSRYVLWWHECIRSCMSSYQGRMQDALSHARRSLEISMDNGYENWVAEFLVLLLVPVAELYERGEMKEYLQRVFLKIDPDMKATLSRMETMAMPDISRACRIILDALPSEPPPGLKIYTLGRFQLYRGVEEISANAWTSKKARMLFKLLVLSRSRGYVNKEVFMEHLWPEQDPQKTAKRFHVALAALRKILEPSLQRGVASAYILNDEDNYLLDLGTGGYIDLEGFEDACLKAGEPDNDDQAIGHLLRAADIFQGDFLEEDLYEPWCARERERIKEEYLSVLASIVDYYESKKDYQKAIDFCGKYLAKDAYAEDMYLRLMQSHAKLGNKAMVKKTYEKCLKNIVSELGCTLNSETELLAGELVAAAQG